MSFLSGEHKHEIIDFFEGQASFLLQRKINLALGFSDQDFYREIIKPLRNMLFEAMNKNAVPPLSNVSNILPCVFVIPEEAMDLSEQYDKFGFVTSRDPRIENRIKLSYYQRHEIVTIGAWPYLMIAVQIVGPFSNQEFLGTIDNSLGRNVVMVGLDGLMGILMACSLNKNLTPWKTAGGKGEVALGYSAKEDGEKITYPVADFESPYGVMIKPFTSDKTKRVSPHHRFLVSHQRLRVQI